MKATEKEGRVALVLEKEGRVALGLENNQWDRKDSFLYSEEQTVAIPRVSVTQRSRLPEKVPSKFLFWVEFVESQCLGL